MDLRLNIKVSIGALVRNQREKMLKCQAQFFTDTVSKQEKIWGAVMFLIYIPVVGHPKIFVFFVNSESVNMEVQISLWYVHLEIGRDTWYRSTLMKL